MTAAAIALILSLACQGNADAMEHLEMYEEACNGMDGLAAQIEAEGTGACRYFEPDFVRACPAISD